MKFDIIIGNPPFNNSIDYEFIKLAYNDMKPNYICFIHPAKWKSDVNTNEGVNIQNILLDSKKLKCIYFYEAWHSGKTKVWPDVSTCSINYWLLDCNNSYEYVDIYLSMSYNNYKEGSFEYSRRKTREEYFPYLCMNHIVLGIIHKVVTSKDFVSIRDRFKYNKYSKVFISNTLYRVYTGSDVTGDSRPCNFDEDEIDNLSEYLKTRFWRALTRQMLKGFHSYAPEFFNYLPDFDFKNKRITDEYLAELFTFTEEEKDYLSKISITDGP